MAVELCEYCCHKAGNCSCASVVQVYERRLRDAASFRPATREELGAFAAEFTQHTKEFMAAKGWHLPVGFYSMVIEELRDRLGTREIPSLTSKPVVLGSGPIPSTHVAESES